MGNYTLKTVCRRISDGNDLSSISRLKHCGKPKVYLDLSLKKPIKIKAIPRIAAGI